ncbi:MAG: hypothetical protein J6Z08_01285 [Elusimicrobiales bacterium]|nr:hypothetical protein [Elusimicrobiales bacterium]
MKKIIISFFCLMFLPALSSARTVIGSLSWETTPRTEVKDRNATAVYTETRELSVKGLDFDRLRTVISLDNNSEKKEMGIVIRYAFRLQLKNEESGETFWEVPYQADELRVPVVKAGITRDVKILPFKLREQFKRLQKTGFVPVALKIEVMISPRKNVSEDGRITESVIPVKYEAAPEKKRMINIHGIGHRKKSGVAEQQASSEGKKSPVETESSAGTETVKVSTVSENVSAEK